MTSGERKNQTKSGSFYYWTKGVMIVNVKPLTKPLGN